METNCLYRLNNFDNFTANNHVSELQACLFNKFRFELEDLYPALHVGQTTRAGRYKIWCSKNAETHGSMPFV